MAVRLVCLLQPTIAGNGHIPLPMAMRAVLMAQARTMIKVRDCVCLWLCVGEVSGCLCVCGSMIKVSVRRSVHEG